LKSAKILGLRSSEVVTVLNDDRFQDSMIVTWDASLVAEILSQKFVTLADASSPKLDLDVLITFDNKGISSHDNHISLYHGALQWLNSLGQAAEHATLYCLTTTNIVRKYTSLLDAPITIALNLLSRSQSGIRTLPNQLVFLSGFWGYRKAQKAMTRGHQSQMRWFRYGWIGLSRYVGVNDLKKKWPVQ
jgi:N-acetylglucosaminylphosphatidylinositol deacetylase